MWELFTCGGGITVYLPHMVIGGSSELPMWLTGCFLVTFFGRWWGLCAYTVILKFWWLVRATYVVDELFFGHFFWKVVGTVCIHGNT